MNPATAARLERTKAALAVLMGFSIPIGPALPNIVIPLLALLVLYTAADGRAVSALRANPVALVAALLFGLILAGTLYTAAPLGKAWDDALKYRELLWIPLFVVLFQDPQTRRYGLYAFLTAMGLTLLLSYLMALAGWPLGKGTPDNPHVFKTHITQGFLMSLAAYCLLVHGWGQPRWRSACGLVALAAAYNVLFMTQSRTGYLVLASLLVLFLYQRFGRRGLVSGLAAASLLGVFAYSASDVVETRIDEVSADMRDYGEGNVQTSIAFRLEFYRNALVLAARHPLLGSGTGSFLHEYRRLVDGTGRPSTDNPHNEYLRMAAQWGLVGAGLFIYLLYTLWRSSSRLEGEWRWMAQGLAAAMAIGCLFNSFLLDSTEGHAFAYLAGLLYAGLAPPAA